MNDVAKKIGRNADGKISKAAKKLGEALALLSDAGCELKEADLPSEHLSELYHKLFSLKVRLEKA